MAKMKKPATVEEYISFYPKWEHILNRLREIVLSLELKEGIKWMFPCYMDKGKNIVALGATKNYATLWFFQGGTLRDEKNVLSNAQEGKTKAMRQWKFNALADVKEDLIRAYIAEAIDNQRNGNIIKANISKNRPLIIPPELQEVLDQNSDLRTCFEQFSTGNKRDFAEYIATAKRAETKERRIKKIIPMILDKVGLNDKYR